MDNQKSILKQPKIQKDLRPPKENRFRAVSFSTGIEEELSDLTPTRPTSYSEIETPVCNEKFKQLKRTSLMESVPSGVIHLAFQDVYNTNLLVRSRLRINTTQKNARNIQDSRYSWFIAALFFIMNFITAGYTANIGLLHTALLDIQPGNTFVILSLIMGFLTGLRELFGPISQVISALLGQRNALIFSGALMSLGVYCSYFFIINPTVLVLGLGVLPGIAMNIFDHIQVSVLRCYFNKRLGRATALRSIGYPIGSTIYSPILAYFIENHGIRHSLIMISFFIAQICAIAVLIRPYPIHKKLKMSHCEPLPKTESVTYRHIESSTTAKKNKIKVADINLLLNFEFVLILLFSLARAIADPLCLFFIPYYCKFIGFTYYQIAMILIALTLMDIVYKVIIGFIVDKNLFKTSNIVAIGHMVGGISLLMMPFSTTFWSVLTLSAIFPIIIASYAVAFSVLITDRFGESASSAFGISRFFHGVVHLLVPTLFGIILQKTSDYWVVFLALSSGPFLATIFIVCQELIARWKNYRQEYFM